MILRERPSRPWRLAACIAVSVASATSALALQAPPSETTVTGVAAVAAVKPSDWITKPTAQQMHDLLPRDVAQWGLKGTAVLKCRILPSTSVTDCSVVYDTDTSHVLGDLALRASPFFRIKQRTVNGTPVDDSWILIPFNLDVKASK